MTKFSRSWKHDQVFISFRGEKARIWGWREALVYIGGILGSPHKKGDPEGPLVTDIVVKLKKMLRELSYPRDDHFNIDKFLMHPQKAVTSLLQALNLNKTVLKDLITKPSIHSVSMILDDLVFLDLISLKNPELAQGLTKHSQAGSIFLLLLGSLDVYDKEFEFQPLLLSKKPQRFPGNKPVVSSQEIQDQSYSSPVQVTNVLATIESNDNTRNRLGDDKISDDDTLACFTFLCNIMKRCAMMTRPPPDRASISFGEEQLEETQVSSLISPPPDRAFISFGDKQLEKTLGWFLYRLLKIEQEVRKDVNRKSVKAILDTEARIWGWRQAIRSISSKPGFSNEYSSDPLFFTAVMTKVKEMFEFKDRPKKSSQMIEETPLMHQHDDLFYSLASFLQALNLENTDLEGFREHNGLISLSLKRYPNLVFLNLGSFDNMVEFKCSKSFEFLIKGFGLKNPGISKFEEPSRVLVSSRNHQYHINQVQNPSSRHVATFTINSPVEAEPATPPVTTSELTTTNLVTLPAPISNSLTNEVEGNVSGRTFEALDTGSRFEKGDTSQRTRGGSGSPGLMLFPKDGGCVLYNPKEGTFQRKLGDFSGCRFLANSGNWLLLLDSGSNLYIVDAFSEKKIRLPSLESIDSADCIVKCVGDRKFIRQDSDSIFRDLSADVVRGLLWVSESAKQYVVVWLFDLPGHSYMSFCKNGDFYYTDIPLFHHQDLHWLDGLSEMVLWGTRLYLSTSRRYVRVLDLSGPQGYFKDITDGQVLLVESDPCNRTCFRLYKKNPDIENPDLFGHTVTEVDSLGGEALLLDLGYTVPANKALGIKPDSIYFTRHYRPCQCASPDLDICVYNLASKTLHRFPDLDIMNLMDARCNCSESGHKR
ncbi:hypothetical protein IGI04_001317 [Brassica rapa subsp. trilocularis]|uniref:KIB1-4 beta-propeller domain-containing protein n=1 Tax=Brassica rapa subsp. trilocularis TaxID=1813537 RepID=A0ABQ7NSB0_BRACM|nr:hypothetical protein IGI04_001317 [Brassica rapa subsp. trilocularis]